MSNWREITVETTEEAAEAVANLFYEVGAQGVVIEDPRVIARYLEENVWDAYELPSELLEAENIVIKVYLPVDERLEERLKLFESRLAGLERYFVSWLAKVSYAEIAEADWSSAWKTYYKPQRVGERVVISPSWEQYEAQPGDIVVWLDPGMAFGTGSHPTTAMLIQLMERYLAPGSDVVDVGTGSGVLAIVAAKLGAKSVLALDIDTLAVEIAEQNAALNAVSRIVSVRYNDLLMGLEGRYQMITANITADPILALLPDARRLLDPGGVLLASGIIRHRYRDIEAKLRALGYTLVETLTEGEWVSLAARKD
ncbi:MAG TPA: 50S ribosomal protein L11 methyltransferase [Clostridia bacterium]|nr:50S ribosomal protein L11 methyltransferase [Clostridia bacterium]